MGFRAYRIMGFRVARVWGLGLAAPREGFMSKCWCELNSSPGVSVGVLGGIVGIPVGSGI